MVCLGSFFSITPVRWTLSITALVVLLSLTPPRADTQTRIPSHPNVILITLDTTRADRMGFLGSSRGLTPNLDSLAQTATVFTRAYAQVPLTTPSHATILTGTYPQFHHVNYMGDPLGKSLPYLPEIFHNHGYRTAAFVGALVLEPKKLALGFERGFDFYDAGFHRRRTNEDRYHSLERRGEDVVAHALAWLSHRPAGPFFLWLHLYDPHDSYTPPEPFKTRYKAEPYDGEIAYTDAALAKLTAWLRTRGLLDSAIIAVMADHGEAFGEHGENHHGIFLHDETIHVPLLIKVPHQRDAKTVADRVGLVDVAPTLLQAAHLAVPAAVQGGSLLGLMKAGDAHPSGPTHSFSAPGGVYSESGYGRLSFGWSKLRAWRSSKYLYIEAPERELYDQTSDPQASRNLAADLQAITDTAGAQMGEFYRKTKGGTTEGRRLDPEQAENLHALGYLASSTGDTLDADKETEGADPKQKIAIANLLYDALVLTEQERFQEAAPILEQVLKAEPNTPIALLQLGRSYMALKKYGNALAPLQALVEKKPDDAFGRYELGCALVKTGRWEDALPQFELAVSLMKESSMMHFYLALVYQRTSRGDEAFREFQSAVRLDPSNFPANLLLGRLLLKQAKAAEATPYLRKATNLRPDSIDAHQFLSDAYQQLGRRESAHQEAEKADTIRARGGARLGTPGKPEERQ